jgi:hypothetical protein
MIALLDTRARDLAADDLELRPLSELTADELDVAVGGKGGGGNVTGGWDLARNKVHA